MKSLIKKEIELRLHSRITDFEIFKQGKSRAIKYSFELDGKKYIAKYYRPRRKDRYLTKVFQNMRSEGINIIGILCGFYSVVLFKYCTIVEWVDGDVLDLEKNNYSREQIYDLASKAAVELRKIHRYPTDPKYNLNLKKDFRRTIHFLINHRVSVPHMDEFINIVETWISENEDTQYGMTHLDFHPGNILYNLCNVTIIDTETFDITHPWRDLTYALCLNHPYENTYWMSFILAYFDWNIPDEFWTYSRTYVIYHFLKLLVSNYLNDSLKEVYPLAEKIYFEYDGLNSNIPRWVDDSLRKLQEEGVMPNV